MCSMPKFIVLVLIVFGMLLLIFYFLQPDSEIDNQLLHQSVPLQSSAVTAVGTPQLAISAPTPMSKKTARPQLSLFHAVTLNQVLQDSNFIFRQRLKQAETYPIAYNPALIEKAQVGEQVHFYLPELGIDVQGTISQVDDIDQDIRRWNGELNQQPKTAFGIIQSHKDHYSIIQLQTEHGLYIAEIKNGLGVISREHLSMDHDQVQDIN